MRNKFETDLLRGQEAEKEFTEVLSKHFNTSVRLNESTEYEELRKYDIIMDYHGREIYFELKNDERSLDTGNFAIEYFCNNKRSGLYGTKAHYYCLRSGDIVYIFKPKVLKQYIDSIAVDTRVVYPHTHIYLLPITTALKNVPHAALKAYC